MNGSVNVVENFMSGNLNVSPKTVVIALGGGAWNIARHAFENIKLSPEYGDVNFITVDMNRDNTRAREGTGVTLLIGKDILGEHKDTEGNVKVAEYIMRNHVELIINTLEHVASPAPSLVIPIAVLGGGTGTGGFIPLIEALENYANERNTIIAPIMVEPMEVESARVKNSEKVIGVVKEHFDTAKLVKNVNLSDYADVSLHDALNNVYDKVCGMILNMHEIVQTKYINAFENTFGQVIYEFYGEERTVAQSMESSMTNIDVVVEEQVIE